MLSDVTITSSVGVIIAMWIVSLCIGRNSRWVFPLWFPLTAVAVLGTCCWLFALLSFFALTVGASGGWEALSPLVGSIILLPAPLILGCSLYNSPSSSATSPIVVAATVAGCFILVAALTIKLPNFRKTPVHLQLVSIDNRPIVGAQVSYITYPEQGSYAPSIRAVVTTDDKGYALLYTRQVHVLTAVIEKAGYSYTRFEIGSSNNLEIRPTTISWQGAAATDHRQDNQNAKLVVPNTKELSLRLYLAREGIDTLLPYPP